MAPSPRRSTDAGRAYTWPQREALTLAISFGSGSREDDVVSLIAARKYTRAIEILKAQLQKRGANPSLRMQLADVLVLAEKRAEAVALLLPLADQYASDGFAAKAVSVLKKVQKLEPGRSDVQSRLARLIEEKQREAVVLPLSRPSSGAGPAHPLGSPETHGGPGADLEIGFGMAPISVSAPAAPAPPEPALAPPAPASPPPAAAARPGAGGAESGFALLPTEEAAPARPATQVRRPGPSDTLPATPGGRQVVPRDAGAQPSSSDGLDLPDLAPAPAGPASPLLESADDGEWLAELHPVPAGEPLSLGEPEPDLTALPTLTPGAGDAMPIDLGFAALEPAPHVGAREVGIEDYDLLYAGEEDEEALEVLTAEPEPPAAASTGGELSDGQFADELMSLVDTVFQEAPAAPAAQPAPPTRGPQIVVSPLFRSFSVDEMVAVIEGLKLLDFERGDVILREGDPGSSLYTLTAGRVRAFRKDRASGKQLALGDLKEGAFFGELSVLTGAPRTATVVALTRCELLELDRATLDEITRSHPHVWDVLREFASQRHATR